MKFEKPVVGQTLYLVDVGNRARYVDGDHRECEVTKVGRKYFEVEFGVNWKSKIIFHIDTRQQKTEYSPSYALFSSEQVYLDYNKKCKLHIELSNIFDGYRSRNNISLHDLIQIADILNIQVD